MLDGPKVPRSQDSRGSPARSTGENAATPGTPGPKRTRAQGDTISRWILAYDGYDPAAEGLREALCTLGNGYFATRGAAPESSADDVHYPGTYIAGCYNRLTAEIDGRRLDNADLVNMPNWLPPDVPGRRRRVVRPGQRPQGGPAALLPPGTRLRRGVLTRLVRVRDQAGRTFRVAQRRMVSFLTMRFPEIARALLMYRWRRLPAARCAAADAGHRGAMYPWQSATDGCEETHRVHLNPRSGRWLLDHTHLQRHVGLTVALNVWRFYEATGDAEFLAEYGAEIMLEVARFFADLADYDRSTDRYRVRGVMGPDEYHDAHPGRDEPGLDDNAYTNVLTAWLLRRALDALAGLPEDRRAELRERLALTREEITRFEDVARKMYVPFHDGVISQFDGYSYLEELDWAGYRERYGDIRRLDRILEAEGDSPNNYKASKQADVLLLYYVLSPEELDGVLRHLGYDHGPALAARTIEYYLPRTCDGSTLSSLVHAWILAHTDGDEAWRIFLEALFSDVGDVQRGTTAEDVHLGAMAGTVDLVQRCHAGIATRDGSLRLAPRLPSALDRLRLGLRFRGHWGIDLICRRDRIRVALRPGAASPIRISYAADEIEIPPGGSWEAPLDEGRPAPPGGLTGTTPPTRDAAKRIPRQWPTDRTRAEGRESRGILPDLFDWIESPFTMFRTGTGHTLWVENYMDDGDHVIRAELPGKFHYGSFTRSFTLPADTKVEDIKASYDKGILTVRVPMPKAAKTESKRIPVER
ncbi:glycosyl hydrolase family 65 protein [Actinomadura sp. B10D3]|uniref:glycosyl hydrolase family 65 protein n=1 Tax=Actinomadura sp. B10D3 TaxID=3153557 RepID=UPI00325F2981